MMPEESEDQFPTLHEAPDPECTVEPKISKLQNVQFDAN